MNSTQELTQSLKNVTTDATKGSGNTYGSADDVIIINKKSYFNEKCCFKYLPLIIAIIALTISLINTGMFVNNKNDTNDALNLQKQSVGHLSRNFILSQFAAEQRIRSEGDSGITNVRQTTDGDEFYDDGTYSNGAISAIHDHADFINTAGMGEVEAVLNGVEFQTRHNDYLLEMPSTTSSEYGVTEKIPHPPVPPEVSAYGDDIDGQISEMQEWFRAFKTENKSHRNYTQYFKPILCYLEGTWILDEGVLEEPFDSDRHEIDASTWKELHDKVRYMSNSGRKDPLENLAHLPSSIRNVIDDIYPAISNWEYRIVCTPLKNNIPFARFRVANDLSVQLFNSPLSRDELYYSRRARFEIAKYINVTDPDGSLYGEAESYPSGYWQPGATGWNFLDYLMEQAPGKDNYMANLTDYLPGSLFGDDSGGALHYIDRTELNSGYYNRFYQTPALDAMGTTRHRRSYSDRYLFTAKTTQKRVSPVSMIWETRSLANIDDPTHSEFIESRWSYAIPLEIIYTTPLINWNPHGIKYLPFYNASDITDPTLGLCSGEKPYPGWTDFTGYYTPAGFFSGLETSQGDTARSDRCALDSNGISQPVFASGIWITTPPIGGDVGYIRQRYPIPTIHTGGHGVFKDVKALQAILLDDEYDDPINGVPMFGDGRDRIYGFDITVAGGSHSHIMHIPGWKLVQLWVDAETDQYLNGSDYTMIADTSVANGHEHAILAWRWRENDNSTSQWHYVIQQCAFGTESNPGEWMDDQCPDGHTALVRA